MIYKIVAMQFYLKKQKSTTLKSYKIRYMAYW